MGIPIPHCLFVYLQRLLFPPRVEVPTGILFQSSIDIHCDELIADVCRGQALAESWEGFRFVHIVSLLSVLAGAFRSTRNR